MNALDHLTAIVRAYDPESGATAFSAERLDATHRAITNAHAWLRTRKEPQWPLVALVIGYGLLGFGFGLIYGKPSPAWGIAAFALSAVIFTLIALRDRAQERARELESCRGEFEAEVRP